MNRLIEIIQEEIGVMSVNEMLLDLSSNRVVERKWAVPNEEELQYFSDTANIADTWTVKSVEITLFNDGTLIGSVKDIKIIYLDKIHTFDDLSIAWETLQNGLNIARSAKKRLEQTIQEEIEQFNGTEVADENGNPLIVYHFTNHKFTKFDINKARSRGYSTFGFWFGSDEEKSSEYGRIKKSCYLDLTDMIVFDSWEDFLQQMDNVTRLSGVLGEEPKEYREFLISRGYDGAKFKNVDLDGGGEQDVYVAFYPEQIECI